MKVLLTCADHPYHRFECQCLIINIEALSYFVTILPFVIFLLVLYIDSPFYILLLLCWEDKCRLTLLYMCIIQSVYVTAWSREGSRLPAGASERDGQLVIRSSQPSDSGTYICTGSNQFERRTENVVVRVIPRRVQPPTRLPPSPSKSPPSESPPSGYKR